MFCIKVRSFCSFRSCLVFFRIALRSDLLSQWKFWQLDVNFVGTNLFRQFIKIDKPFFMYRKEGPMSPNFLSDVFQTLVGSFCTWAKA